MKLFIPRNTILAALCFLAQFLPAQNTGTPSQTTNTVIFMPASENSGTDTLPPGSMIEESKPVDNPLKEEKVYEIFDVQKAPQFPGAEQAMMNYLNENLQYPQAMRERKITGMVAIQFTVGSDGVVRNPRILKDIGGGAGKEAIRLVNNMPVWIPAEKNGQKVSCTYTLPVRFQLPQD